LQKKAKKRRMLVLTLQISGPFVTPLRASRAYKSGYALLATDATQNQKRCRKLTGKTPEGHIYDRARTEPNAER